MFANSTPAKVKWLREANCEAKRDRGVCSSRVQEDIKGSSIVGSISTKRCIFKMCVGRVSGLRLWWIPIWDWVIVSLSILNLSTFIWKIFLSWGIFPFVACSFIWVFPLCWWLWVHKQRTWRFKSVSDDLNWFSKMKLKWPPYSSLWIWIWCGIKDVVSSREDKITHN